MAPYLVHRSRERARIRHAALADLATQARVFEFLKGEAGIAGIKPGRASFLILMEPGCDLERILAGLEKAFPFLATEEGAKQTTPAARQAKAGKHRRWRLLTMLGFGLTTVGLAATGLKHAHALAGGIFALFATDHVWHRRKAL